MALPMMARVSMTFRRTDGCGFTGTSLMNEPLSRQKQAPAAEEQPASPEQADLQPKKEEALPLPPKRPRRERITFTTLHPEIPRDQRHDFHITDDALGHGTPSEKYAANVAAIRTLKQIEAENGWPHPKNRKSYPAMWAGAALQTALNKPAPIMRN